MRRGKNLVLALFLMLGFFGGELVLVSQNPAAAKTDPALELGTQLFANKCSICHYTDRQETKVGPGLKGLFQQEQLPASKKPVSDASIAEQLKKPFGKMPPFPDLTDEQVKSLIAYLKTI